jgi:hypothetical protein
MHLYNCILVVLLISRLNLAFLSPKFSHGIDIVLVCLYPCGFDNPRNTVRWKLLQLASVRLRIILFGLRTTNNRSSYSLLSHNRRSLMSHSRRILLSCNTRRISSTTRMTVMTHLTTPRWVPDCARTTSWSAVPVGYHQGPGIQGQECSLARAHGVHLHRGGLWWAGGGQQAWLSLTSCDLCWGSCWCCLAGADELELLLAPWPNGLYVRTLHSKEEGCFQDFSSEPTNLQRSDGSQHETLSGPEQPSACHSEGDPQPSHPTSRYAGHPTCSSEDAS